MTTATTTASSNDQLRQKAHEIKDNIVEMAGIAKSIASDKIDGIREGASSRYQAGVDKAGEARDGILDYVKAHPTRSLLACLCVGAVTGYLVSRRR